MGELNAALVEEAAKKSGLLWLDLPGLPQPRAAWHLWHEGSAYVLTGGEGEQPLPGLPEAGQAGERVTVILRSKDKGGRLVSFAADAEVVEPGSELWDTVAPLLAKDRLNAASHEGQAERWAAESWIVRLTPAEEVTEAAEEYATVRPVPTPATTAGAPPRLFGGKRRHVDR
ncbi:hypothetical protein E1264_04965 [Actinomadura sp. KC216]|uniref:hypothetical protein n=1 Tax=Actinomadura sp. KC216 TaxID=2530370 RepID=UPI0010532F41|nr:hypothetical protein [Actinomadura sp. KC216]TDB90477.1 hypothetical protein E1264_04965 [Actinomadura sp. KC216]